MTTTAADQQATKFAWSLVHGEPSREQIVLTVLADTARERF